MQMKCIITVKNSNIDTHYVDTDSPYNSFSYC